MGRNQLIGKKLTKLDLELLGETSICDNIALIHNGADEDKKSKSDKGSPVINSGPLKGLDGQCIMVCQIETHEYIDCC